MTDSPARSATPPNPGSRASTEAQAAPPTPAIEPASPDSAPSPAGGADADPDGPLESLGKAIASPVTGAAEPDEQQQVQGGRR